METRVRYLYLLSFLEGAAVMVCELIGAKMLAPFFGTSLYVWAAALGLTLGGLMTGYFLGGKLSSRFVKKPEVLYLVLVAAGLFLSLMPITSEVIMGATINMQLQTGAILSLLVFMVPPLVCMGMVSPLIIGLLTDRSEKAGNSAGNVYAISTLGGILATFFMGFYVIPEFGISTPAIVSGALLCTLPLINLLRLRYQSVTLLTVLAIAFISWQATNPVDLPPNVKILYNSEGILGQIKVVDHPAIEFTDDQRMGRGLIVNNTLQTFVGLENDLQYSIWAWAHYFPTAASIYPPESTALILGMGGGTIAKQFDRLDFETDIVEIDSRIRDISYQYFNVDPSIEVIIDDARHYVRTTDKSYDILVYDTFLSESVPEHLLTVEGFEDARKILNPGGVIMINFYGFLDGEAGRAARSVLYTLLESGFKVELLPTAGNEDSRNIIFIASEELLDFTKINYSEPTTTPIQDLYTLLLDVENIDLSDAVLLTDDRPILSKLYTRASMKWKRSYNDYYLRNFPELIR